MSAPLFYRSGSKWQIVTAFTSAVLIHLAAVALAELKPDLAPAGSIAIEDPSIIVETDIIEPPAPPLEIDEPHVEPPPPPATESDFQDYDTTTPPPRRPAKAAPPITRPPSNAAPRGPSGSPKAFALTAPRPEYPYEARRQRLTGSGLATLTIDRTTGAVIRVTMARSTGSAVLDNATISGLRRWRFKPGTVSQVQTPITYTLTGASY